MIFAPAKAATKATFLADDLVLRFEERISSGDMAPGARFPTVVAICEASGASQTVAC